RSEITTPASSGSASWRSCRSCTMARSTSSSARSPISKPMPYCAGASAAWEASAPRALADSDVEFQCIATAQYSQAYRLTYCTGAEPVGNVADRTHRLTIPCGDYVADKEAPCGGRAFGLEADHDGAAPLPHRMQADAEP